MYEILDIDHWNRKQIYHFFKGFDEPYFGVTVDVDVTKAYAKAKDRQTSFFLYYLHKSLKAVNGIPPFLYRIDHDNVLVYKEVHASATVNREDGTFGFSYMPFDSDYRVFEKNALMEIDRIRSTDDLFPAYNGSDVVHFSAIPWLKFTSLSHARILGKSAGEPKISFGKVTNVNGALTMPCSVHVHHGLMDGKDVGSYFELFQQLLDED